MQKEGYTISMLQTPIRDDEEESAFDLRLIIMSVLMLMGIAWLALRLSPWCFIDTGTFGWKTWTYAFPNLVCALDLREAGGKAFDEEVNKRIRYFTNLQKLDLAKNNLTQMPSEIVSLAKLQSLSLADNHLTSLPSEIDTLTALESLDVSNNNLQDLPDSLGNMKLSTIDLSDNEITEFPPGLITSPYLQDIDLSLNPVNPKEQQQIAETVTENIVHASSSPSSPSSLLSSSSFSSNTSTASQTSSLSSVEQIVMSSAESSQNSTGSGTSFTASGSVVSSEASSEETTFYCDRNLTINSYHLCIPPEWTAENLGKYSGDLKENGVLMAKIQCPLEQKNYSQWDFSIRNRTFLRNNEKYGTDLWYGTPNTTGSQPFLILFMHKHDFNSWYGDNYIDVLASCQIESMQPENHQSIFRTMYLSIE